MANFQKDLLSLHNKQIILLNLKGMTMTDKSRLDFVRGSLIGGAAGDALGYPVEFDSYQEIIAKNGKPGIKSYELTNGVAEISDDTQMTLFTANGMLMGLTRWQMVWSVL